MQVRHRRAGMLNLDFKGTDFKSVPFCFDVLHLPVDQEGEAEAVAGLGLFVAGGEVGLDGPFGDVEIGQDRIFITVVQISLDKISPDYYNATHERFNGH